jgi:hypothetical protein
VIEIDTLLGIKRAVRDYKAAQEAYAAAEKQFEAACEAASMVARGLKQKRCVVTVDYCTYLFEMDDDGEFHVTEIEAM